MTEHQLIILPQELVQQWVDEIYGQTECDDARDEHIAIQAAHWGADQELEACCEWLEDHISNLIIDMLRAARRPKPPSLKELALARTNAILNDPNRALLTEVRETLELNRRALEQLDD